MTNEIFSLTDGCVADELKIGKGNTPTCRECGEEVSYGALHVCRPVCEWKNYDDLWVDTSCEETIRGIPPRYKFCPYCGGRIKVTE